MSKLRNNPIISLDDYLKKKEASGSDKATPMNRLAAELEMYKKAIREAEEALLDAETELDDDDPPF